MIELKDLTDEDLEKKLRVSGVVRRYPGLQDWVLELLKRYNNKKKECEKMADSLAKQEDQMSKASYLLKWRHSQNS